MTVDELEMCFRLLVEKLKTFGIYELDSGDADYYWDVLEPHWLDVTQAPKLGVGSLLDDISGVRKALEQPEDATVPELARIASLLRVIGSDVYKMIRRETLNK